MRGLRAGPRGLCLGAPARIVARELGHRRREARRVAIVDRDPRARGGDQIGGPGVAGRDHRDAPGHRLDRHARDAREIRTAAIGQDHAIGRGQQRVVLRAVERLVEELDPARGDQRRCGRIERAVCVHDLAGPLDREARGRAGGIGEVARDRVLQHVDALFEPRRAEAGEQQRGVRIACDSRTKVVWRGRRDARAGEHHRGQPGKRAILVGQSRAVGGEDHAPGIDVAGEAAQPPAEQLRRAVEHRHAAARRIIRRVVADQQHQPPDPPRVEQRQQPPRPDVMPDHGRHESDVERAVLAQEPAHRREHQPVVARQPELAPAGQAVAVIAVPQRARKQRVDARFVAQRIARAGVPDHLDARPGGGAQFGHRFHIFVPVADEILERLFDDQQAFARQTADKRVRHRDSRHTMRWCWRSRLAARSRRSSRAFPGSATRRAAATAPRRSGSCCSAPRR